MRSGQTAFEKVSHNEVPWWWRHLTNTSTNVSFKNVKIALIRCF